MKRPPIEEYIQKFQYKDIYVCKCLINACKYILYLESEKKAEGHKLAYLSPLSPNGELTHGFRIARPKAWGGSRTLAKIELTSEDIIRYINEYAPDIKELLRGSAGKNLP